MIFAKPVRGAPRRARAPQRKRGRGRRENREKTRKTQKILFWGRPRVPFPRVFGEGPEPARSKVTSFDKKRPFFDHFLLDLGRPRRTKRVSRFITQIKEDPGEGLFDLCAGFRGFRGFDHFWSDRGANFQRIFDFYCARSMKFNPKH